jgi:hypothetical protein
MDFEPVDFDAGVVYSLPRGYLSPAQVIYYGLCGACYQAAYIEGKPRKISLAMPLGSAVHGGLALARWQAKEGQAVVLPEVLETGMDRFVRGIGGEDPLDPDPPAEVVPEWTAAELGVASHQVREILEAHTLPLTERDLRAGILEIEAEVDYTDVFPFAFKGYLDLRVTGGIDELKTSARRGTPGLDAAFQVACYSLPTFRLEGAITPLTITKIVKNATSVVETYSVEVDPARLQGVYDDIMQAAADISAGRFPVGPGRYGTHDFEHPRPAAHFFGG